MPDTRPRTPRGAALRCSRAAAVAAVCVALLAACGKSPAPTSPAAQRTSTEPTTPAPPPTGTEAPWVGAVLRPGDPDALRRYLETVHEITPTKFKVEWNPATVAFDRAAAIRALRGVSRDGRRFTLDPAEPAVAKLVPGSILWIYDVTVSKVDRVERRHGSAVVYTRPVPLNEAIPNGEIAFDARVPVGSYLLARRPPRPASRTASLGRRASPYLLVASAGPPDAAPPDSPAPDGDAADAADEAEAAADDEALHGNTYRGSLKGYDFAVGYAPGPNDSMKIRIEASRVPEGGGGSESGQTDDQLESKWHELHGEEESVRKEIREIRAKLYEAQEGHAENPVILGQERLLKEAKERLGKLDEQKLALKALRQAAQEKLWDVFKETLEEALEARFKMEVDMDGFSAAGDYLFSKGDVAEAKFALKALSGHAKIKTIARLGKKGDEGSKIPLMDIPIAFNVPLPIGGIPFVLQISADFNINVFLAGLHAALAVEGEYAFNGNTGFTYSKTSSEYTGSFDNNDPGIKKYAGMSPGASAFVLGVQLPRIGYGIGLLGVSSIAYFDIIHVLTMTNAASALAGLMPPCKRITYAAVGRIGIETEAVPIPIEAVQTFVKDKLSPKKEVFKREKIVTDPPLKACEIG